MCCFSGPVRSVSNTRIFARLSSRKSQFLVYRMSYSADRELAMILPLPVALPAAERSVRFINLKGYPTFFEDMDKGFPNSTAIGIASAGIAGSAGARPLPMHLVGDFVASFVPSLNDFRRLDARFKLPRRTWEQIPAYQDYGFAVFQLQKRMDMTNVHPIALEFATRREDSLFFPTVHIHDGLVHDREQFDHLLYMQDARLRLTPPQDALGRPLYIPYHRRTLTSEGSVRKFMDVERAQGILAPNEIAFRQPLIGSLPNQDTIIRLS